MKKSQTNPDIIRTRYTSSIAFRSISGIVALLILYAVIVGYLGYRRFSESILDQYAEGALLTANTAADIIDGEDLYRFNQSNGDDGLYYSAYNELQRLCNSSGSTFLYVIQPDTTDYQHIKFIFAVQNYKTKYETYDFGYVRETTNDEYREKYRSLYEQRTFSEIVVRDKGFIATDPHITAMIPLRGSDNQVKGILCVQRQLDELFQVRRDYVNRVVAVLLILSILAIIGQSMHLHLSLLDPLRKITAEARRFADENVSNDTKLSDSIRNKDEIGILAGSIDRMEERIEAYVEDITRITAERERIVAELSLATRIQADMLPNDFPAFPDRTEFDIYASMTPAKEVGGDFYDFFLIDDDHLGIVIADVSGKGIPAALFMMLAMILIKNQTHTDRDPASVLETVNNHLCENNREEMFVTVWLGILDLKTGLLTASNAGHEYPMLKDPGDGFRIYRDEHGFIIGGMAGMKYKNYEIRMEKGSKLFLYTDGLSETQSRDGKLFGTERAVSVLNSHSDDKPQKLIDEMGKAVREFSDGAPQFDDLTMLCIEYEGDQNGRAGSIN